MVFTVPGHCVTPGPGYDCCRARTPSGVRPRGIFWRRRWPGVAAVRDCLGPVCRGAPCTPEAVPLQGGPETGK